MTVTMHARHVEVVPPGGAPKAMYDAMWSGMLHHFKEAGCDVQTFVSKWSTRRDEEHPEVTYIQLDGEAKNWFKEPE